MRRYKMLLMIFSFLCVLLSACQPTPREDIVVNKAELDTYETSAAVESYAAPSEWVEQIENGKITYSIEASVTVPNVTHYPVIEVSPAYFDYADIDAIIYGILPDAEIRVENLDTMTKAQYQSEMDVILNSIERVEINHPDLSGAEKEEYIKQRQADLAAVQELYNQAPDEREHRKIKSIAEMADTAEYIYSGAVYTPNGRPKFDFYLSNPAGDARGTYFELRPNGAYEVEENRFVEVEGIADWSYKMDHMRVEEVANSFMQRIGLDDQYTFQYVYQIPWSKVAVYTKSYDGIPATYAKSYAKSKLEPYEYDWSIECVRVTMDMNYNITYLEWNSPSRIDAVIHENVSLLPFEEVQKLITTNIRYFEPSLRIQDEALHRTIVIKRIVLGFMRVRQIGLTERYQLIPVWDCFGYYKDHFASQADSEFVVDENNDAIVDTAGGSGSFLTINAIDGSLIDRNVGY